MVNIIYQDDGNFRTTQFDVNTTYNLNDILFFVPNSKKLLALYCILKNNDQTDSLELSPRANTTRNYDSYGFSNEYTANIESGTIKLILFGIYEDNTTILSKEFEINITLENFNLLNQLYVMTKFGADVALQYNQMVEFVKLGASMVSDMQALMKGGTVNDK